MKPTQILPFILFLFLTQILLAKDGTVQVSCTHYYMSVANTTDHALKVQVLKGGKILQEPTLMYPGSSFTIHKKFTKSRLKKIQIICDYDSECYNWDKRKNDQTRSNNLTSLQNSYNQAVRASQNDLLIKLGAEAASNWETNSDDDRLTAFIKGLTRFAGNVTKFAYALKETYQQYANKTYNTYEEFFADLALAGIEAQLVKSLSEELERQGLFKASVNKYVINSLLYFIQEVEGYDLQVEQKTKTIEDQWAKRDKQLTVLKTNGGYRSNHTYNAYAEAMPANLKTVSPWFGLSLEPLTYGNALNDVWISRPDKILENQDTDDDLEWAGGMKNRYLGGSADVTISPEMVMGKNTYSRLYATVSYHQFAYRMDSIRFRVSDNFFASQATSGNLIEISEPLRFEQSNLSAGLSWRFFLGKKALLDLNGGYIIQQKGHLDLSHSQLPDGYTWSVANINLSESQNIPYFGAKFGFGSRAFHKGFYCTVGSTFYQSLNTNPSDYILKVAATDEVIDFKRSNLFDMRLNIGVSVFF